VLEIAVTVGELRQVIDFVIGHDQKRRRLEFIYIRYSSCYISMFLFSKKLGAMTGTGKLNDCFVFVWSCCFIGQGVTSLVACALK
jgi:hypothetical protein